MELEELKQKILQEAGEGRLSCKSAFIIAGETGASTAEIGQLCDRLKIKIVSCQLGCF